jgi:hypothetical protein
MKNIETKFNIGDKVYLIQYQPSFKSYHHCEDCNGTGKIKTKCNTMDCPYCDEGKIYNNSDYEFVVDLFQLTIREIEISIVESKIEVRYMTQINFGEDSQRYFVEKNLFSTIDEATQECIKRNQK